jgi:P4 family phage/plasmid primase-like protien
MARGVHNEPEEIEAFLAAISDMENGCVELRVFGANWVKDEIMPGDRFSRTLGGWYNSVGALTFDICKLRAISGYVTVNPVDPIFLAKSVNTVIKIQKGQGVADSDIKVLRWAFIDIDPKKPKPDISATDEERQHALDRRDQILADNPDLKACSIWGGSGNGGWILVRLPDYPNDTHHNTLVGRLIDHLHDRYSDDLAEVDTKTRNASRIMGIPGTLKCKGANAPGRFWRKATFDSMTEGYPTKPHPINLSGWLDIHAPQATQSEGNIASPQGYPTVVFPSANSHGANLTDRVTRATAYLDNMAGAIEGQNGHAQTFDAACVLVKGFDLAPGHARPILMGWNQKCQPPWSDYDLDRKLEEANKKSDDKPRGYLLGLSDGIPRFAIEYEAQPPTPDARSHDWTDTGNGKRLVDMYGRQLRYCKSYKEWLVYDGKRWDQDNHYAVELMAKDISARVMQEIPEGADDDEKKRFEKFAKLCQSREKMSAAMTAARSERGVPIMPDQLDTCSWSFNCLNGTIDLLTQQFRPHSPNDLITKLAPVNYDPHAKCPNWDKFILDILGGDHEVVDYVQRAVGYALTGVIREHVLFFLYGTGRNGKTTFLNAIQWAMGDYATEIDSDLLIAQGFPTHPTGLTELQGRRFVVANETDDGKRFAEALIKKLTGGNNISARRMHQDFYTFKPTHHIFLAANYKPDIRGTDPGMWRRIKLIPFSQCYDTELPGGIKPDLELPNKLDEERSGILNWLIEGCRQWQTRSLDEPAAIRKLVNEYRNEQDTLGLWISENCVQGVEVGTKSLVRESIADLYSSYSEWCSKTGSHAFGMRRFAAQLTELGFHTSKSNSTTWKLGIRLMNPVEKQAISNESYESPDYSSSPITGF